MAASHSVHLASDAWIRVLEDGFGADVGRVRDDCVVALFKAGPFRIAYADFPAGAINYPGERLEEIVRWARRRRATLVRLVSREPVQTMLPKRVVPQTSHVIEDLQDWSEGRFEKARRAANRSRRSPLEIAGLRESDADQAYELYRDTVLRHGGSVRYRRAYFRELARTGSGLVARDQGRLAGFVCMARIGDRACYLHGAHDAAMRSLYPSDQLFLAMIRKCRDEGATALDFLPSPPSQQSLKQYKAAWGAVEVPANSTDIVISRMGATMFYALLGTADTLARQVVRARRFMPGRKGMKP